MAEGPYLMGIDYGTGGVRAGIFDIEGTPKVFHAVEFETSYPRPGRAEQDPDTWWSSLVQAVHGAMEESGVAAEAIAGIGVDTTAATVLALDAKDRHLRPAIMWMDVRASDQAEAWQYRRSGAEVQRVRRRLRRVGPAEVPVAQGAGAEDLAGGQAHLRRGATG